MCSKEALVPKRESEVLGGPITRAVLALVTHMPRELRTNALGLRTFQAG